MWSLSGSSSAHVKSKLVCLYACLDVYGVKKLAVKKVEFNGNGFSFILARFFQNPKFFDVGKSKDYSTG